MKSCYTSLASIFQIDGGLKSGIRLSKVFRASGRVSDIWGNTFNTEGPADPSSFYTLGAYEFSEIDDPRNVAYYSYPYRGNPNNLGQDTGDAGNTRYFEIFSATTVHGTHYRDYLAGNSRNNTLYGHDGNDRILGELGNDRIIGGHGIDTLEGGFGDDTLVGDRDNGFGSIYGDVLNGGHGSDTVSYNYVNTGVHVSLRDGVGLGGIARGDTYISIENVIGNRGQDLLIGNGAANRLEGLGGADRLLGYDGNDSLFGGSSNDLLDGGRGRDYLNGGSGTDTVSYWSASSGVTAWLVNPGSNTGDARGDRYVGIENLDGSRLSDRLTGDDGRNTLTGLEGNDILTGYGGDDRIEGNQGNDTLYGNWGRDTLDGGQGFDTASYYTATSGVVVFMDTPGISTGEAYGDTFISIEQINSSRHDDRLVGNGAANTFLGLGGDDELFGRGGNDRLEGGSGQDRLVGEQGYDVLVGGTGRDMFVFRDFSDRDHIVDFNRSEGDKIVLETHLRGTFDYIGSSAFSRGGETEARASGNTLFIDWNGDAQADVTVRIDGLNSGAGWSESDFIFA